MKLQEAAKIFFIYGRVERTYAAETQSKILECFHSWLLPVFGEREIATLTVLDVLELRRQMMDRGLGIARQYNVLTLLKVFLKFCRSVLKQACLDPAEIRVPRRPYHRVEYLSDDEIHRLLMVIPTHTFTGLRLRALIEVLLSTGMRISEALSMKQDVIHTPEGEIEIIGKGGKIRVVFLSTRCLSWIRRFLSVRLDPYPYLFITTGRNPRRLTRNDMSKLFKRLRLKSGIQKRLTPHMLRHTFCTNLLHRGADITFIKELAGHQDIQTTARYYLGVDKKSLRAVLRRCRPFGWGEEPNVDPAPSGLQSTPVHPADTEGILHEPAWRPGDPIPNNSDRLFPGAHVPGFP